MKKLIIALIFILLFSSITYSYQYKLDPIMETIKKQGKIFQIDPNNFVTFLEFHSGDRNKTHTSYYISIFFNKATENIFLPSKLSFIKEEWLLENDIWTIFRYLLNDNNFIGDTDQIKCEILKENINGAVLSLEDTVCLLTEEYLIQEIIQKTANKIKL